MRSWHWVRGGCMNLWAKSRGSMVSVTWKHMWSSCDFRPCHDSEAVVTCALLWLDSVDRNKILTKIVTKFHTGVHTTYEILVSVLSQVEAGDVGHSYWMAAMVTTFPKCRHFCSAYHSSLSSAWWHLCPTLSPIGVMVMSVYEELVKCILVTTNVYRNATLIWMVKRKWYAAFRNGIIVHDFIVRFGMVWFYLSDVFVCSITLRYILRASKTMFNERIH